GSRGQGRKGSKRPLGRDRNPGPRSVGSSTAAARDPTFWFPFAAGLSFQWSASHGPRGENSEPRLPGTGSGGPGPSGASRPALRSQPDKNQGSLMFVQESCPTPAPTVTNGAILALSALPSVAASCSWAGSRTPQAALRRGSSGRGRPCFRGVS